MTRTPNTCQHLSYGNNNSCFKSARGSCLSAESTLSFEWNEDSNTAQVITLRYFIEIKHKKYYINKHNYLKST